MQKNMSKARFLELDLLRGLAVMGMMFFHFFFILDFYGRLVVNFNAGFWPVLAAVVRFLFLSLVGVGMVISYNRRLGKGSGASEFVWRSRLSVRLFAIFAQWKRAVVTGLCAVVITVVTYFFVPDDYIRFGILHLIAVGILFWSFFLEWKWLVLGLSIVSFFVGGWLGGMTGGLASVGGSFGGVGYFLHEGAWNIQALDYFPLFPWIGIIGIGIFLGHLFYPKGQPRFKFWVGGEKFGVITFFGRHALAVYMLHVPIILGVLWVVGLVKI